MKNGKYISTCIRLSYITMGHHHVKWFVETMVIDKWSKSGWVMQSGLYKINWSGQSPNLVVQIYTIYGNY